MKTKQPHPVVAVLFAVTTLTACQQKEPQPELSTTTAHLEASLPPADALTGKVRMDGSNTVFPIAKAMSDAFRKRAPGVEVALNVSGTGGGLAKFCAGEIDLAGASRPINAREAEGCAAKGIGYVELPVGFDSLSVVVSAKNAFVDCLTTKELKAMWEPAADSKVKTWQQVRASFPDTPLSLFGKGTESGTFDYFTLAIVGEESKSRSDYTKTEDDALIARQVGQDPNALGYLGYAKYLAARSELKPVAIDEGKGCVLPSPATVGDGTYQPLSRPLFVYVSQSAAARPEVASFARFLVAPDNAQQVRDVGYVPLPRVGLLAASSRLARGVLGSALGAHGSVVGVRLDSFRDEEEKVKSALVQ